MATLYVVGTPIGNLADLSPRGREVLSACALIAAEDTRVTRVLLSALSIHTPLISYHAHNEEPRAAAILRRMVEEDIDVALVSDAGMPTLSDPGAVLVAGALEAGLPVTCVPGPDAVSTALALTGWRFDSFAFYGFLPRTRKERAARLGQMAQSGIGLAVLYESPARMLDLLAAVEKELPGAQVCACNDLTKKFERAWRGAAGQVLEALTADPNAGKGEYCLVLDLRQVKPSAPQTAREDLPLEARIVALMAAGQDQRQAMEALRAEGVPRNALYRAGLALREMFAGETET